MCLRFNVRVRKQRQKPFAEVLADVVADVRSRPAEPERIVVGLGEDGMLTDDDGCRFELVDGSLEVVPARQLADIADRVVLDECGCAAAAVSLIYHGKRSPLTRLPGTAARANESRRIGRQSHSGAALTVRPSS